MGGSLALALGDGAHAVEPVGWDPDADCRRSATRADAFRVAGTRADALAGADLVVLAAPLSAVPDLMAAVSAEAPGSATVTDVVSLKAPVAGAAEVAGLASRWVGSHPMAGREASGFGAAERDLYRRARAWIVPGTAGPEHVQRVESLWRAVEADPRSIGADEHDRLMALASHLPQLTANALASVLAEAGVAPDRLGPGGADMTRLAASSPAMWADLFGAAPPELAAGLRSLASALADAAALLEEGRTDDLAALMRRTADWKRGP